MRLMRKLLAIAMLAALATTVAFAVIGCGQQTPATETTTTTTTTTTETSSGEMMGDTAMADTTMGH
ncbi:MAG: hypothetical protein A2W00_14215 [Candidatus Eisenbacteria bacterium RBG_16_71_46]|nr:MAG: hypothetical protein A2W00_14215 [Candidatus Eisenbacteria bacterium RBG_16_71_46]